MSTVDLIMLNLFRWILVAAAAGFFMGALLTWAWYRLVKNDDDDYWGCM